MKRVTGRFLQMASLIILSVMISTSIGQLKVSKGYCVGYPCASNAECGTNCFCSGKLGMCRGGVANTEQ